jgi:hypothetical protein
MNDGVNDFEKQVIEIMIDENCTFVEAMHIIFDIHCIDTTSVIHLVEFLEERVDSLDTVGYYMDLWTGREKDMTLKNWH